MRPCRYLPLIACALAACDAQAGSQYGGEPLLTMTGSVTLELNVANEDELIPALGFADFDSQMYIVPAEVEGEFPAAFTLRVYQPPPPGAIQELPAQYPDGPRIAVGYIAAVTADTPSMFRFNSGGTGEQGCFEDSQTQLQVCTTTQSWCTAQDDECYVEVRTCPDAQNNPDDCTVEAQGDPGLKTGKEDMFAGASENYKVLYLEEAAAPRSYIAWLAGKRDEGLAAGYHLIEVEEAGDGSEAADACRAEAEQLALARFNERFGTDYANEEELEALCLNVPGDCYADEMYSAARRLEYEGYIELDCPPYSSTSHVVEDPAHESIEVRIGPGLAGL
jgi:hypothetical protein